mgnify:CR=1 FL=1
MWKPFLTQVNSNDPKYTGKSDYVKSSMMKREAMLLAKQQVALQEKRDNEQKALDLKDAKHDAEKLIGSKLSAWAEESKGQLKNIRVLLATLHTIMWESKSLLYY